MIFSKEKWDKANEIQPYISVSNGLAFTTVQAPLANAFELFLRPLLGDEMVADLIAIYANVAPTDKQVRLLKLAQRANALLAFWYDYDEMQLLIDDAGAKRQESDSVKTPYKYQEQSLKKGWKEKGFIALDDMLFYLEKEIVTFTSFASSPNYTLSKTDIVRNAGEVDQYYYISSSRLVYLRLKPHMKIVIDTIIAARMGAVFGSLQEELLKATPDAKFLKLRTALIPVVVFYSVARLMHETGSLTDKGLFFESLRSSQDMSVTSPIPDERLTMQATMAESDAISYWKIAERVLKVDFEYSVSTGTVPKRDNLNKKSFWA